MRKRNGLVLLLCLFVGAGWLSAGAQTPVSGSHDAAQLIQVPSRIVKAIDNEHLVKLTGNTHPLAQARFEQGILDPSMQLERMMLVLQRSPEQEQALAAFSERQYDPKSPDFHHWLHADEFGRLYGPSDADLSAVENWLVSQGFSVGTVAKGRTWIEFSGNVAQVQNAFHVEMHHYLVNGEDHIANDRDPQIPEALSPVVTGVASLHNFFPKPQMIRGNLVKRDRATGKITVLEPVNPVSPTAHTASAATPQLTYVDSNNHTHEDITPYDFATIYNYLPLWNASKTGTGVKVAIAAGSDIAVADLTNFRKTFGLPATTLNVIHNGTDPGETGANGDQGENTLDVEMVSASAPGATINLVVSANTSTTGGFQLSDAYIIDNEVAPIMSASYGECELELGTTNNAAFNKMWQQGATEGISIFESSGDQGSAGCTSDSTRPNADQVGLQVNGMASSPYVTAVGGTDFTWSFVNTPISTYWNTSNNADLATAKGYLPEVPWNSTCSNPLLLNIFTGEANSEQLCNDAANDGTFYTLAGITGGSGGVSHCTTPSGTTGSTCSGGYAKPSWQTGSGVPADGKRDVPDVSLFASGGFPSGINGSAILFCEAAASSENTCDYTNPDYIIYQEIGGTSASSPLMAGIMALIVQKTGSAQGLANPTLYQLYAKQIAAGTACDSSTDTNASSCIFHDISQGTNSQICITGDLNCVTQTSGDQEGLLSGYAAAKGYDEAIGLGSLNVNNLVTNWISTSGTPTITVSPTTLTFASTTVGSTTAAQVVTVKNTGTVSATLNSETIAGTNASSFVKSATTCGTSLAAGASCTVSVEFKPTATGSLTGSLSVADNATGSPQAVGLSGSATAAPTHTLSVSPTSLTFASTTVGSTSGAQVVTIKNIGTAPVTLTSETLAGSNATAFVKSATTCGNSLPAAASCTVSVEFRPTATGTLTGSISIADNATGSPQSVALGGTATAAATHVVSLSATNLTFASTAVGSTTAAQVISIKNTGTAAVTLTSETITGTNATSFIKSATTCGTSLVAAESCTVSVEFKPAAAGALTGSLSIADNATGTPQVVALKGTATAASTPTVSLSAASIAFPATIVGATSDEQMVMLTNTGATTVTIASITISGTNATAFEYLTTCGTSLGSKASCALYVAFKPATAGALTATLGIADTASGSPQKVTLTGTGAGAPSVKLSVTTLSFPTTKSGSTSAAQSITLTNSGAAAINLSSIALTGSNPTSYQDVTNCSPTLAAGANCVVYVAFSPKTTGALKATLNIVDNGAASPQSVALSGTGN